MAVRAGPVRAEEKQNRNRITRFTRVIRVMRFGPVHGSAVRIRGLPYLVVKWSVDGSMALAVAEWQKQTSRQAVHVLSFVCFFFI